MQRQCISLFFENQNSMPKKITNEYKNTNYFVAFLHDKNCFGRKYLKKKNLGFLGKLIFLPLCV